MEGNEVEKAAREYAKMISKNDTYRHYLWTAFQAGASWQKERENAELNRTSKELDAMTTKYNELSQKYADLYKFAYGMAINVTRPKDDYLNEEI